MPISINPVFPVIAAQEAAPDLVLQPGSVIDARVLKVLEAGLVRIAIASLAIDVLSEVDVQPGAMLKLAVSQTPDGIRLAIISPEDGSGATRPAAVMSAATDLSAIAIPRPVGTPTPTLTPVEALAVTAAAQAAAVKQTGLSPLFANAAAVASSDALPEPLQAAAQQLLAARPALTTSLTGDDIKSAFQNSGLFLETSLASGSPLTQGGMPDLKAALVVFRQTLSTWLDQAAPATAPSPAQASATTAGNAPRETAGQPAAIASLVPDIDVEEVYLPKALLPVAEEFFASDARGQMFTAGAPPTSPGARAAAVTATLNILQDADGAVPAGMIETIRRMVDGKLIIEPVITSARGAPMADEGFARTDMPPPPFRGAAPAPQQVASPSIASDATPVEAVRRLIDDADGAIARQTLLQIASLPDRTDVPGVRIDPSVPRWNFEIPFSTPQGTAVAQFEISRDGGGKSASSAHRVWRARFSLDVEPAGPVHAIVTLTGETTSVRMWAERPATAMQLRDNAVQLTQALRQAELEPGDIVIGEGTPPQPAVVAPAGHFLDRAT
ncbi:flagellar hook-length control protein FliK [Bradyrhizobium prioriisuperbiae]|uniref:flagellar hook-length control protein FliK n=1 Tax=Bradyrhizobium prioriisuperbiae TaxID=2854389 RepID=UPI0028F10456|nr:flagellar hook-length control protein FliK [Bradyrhizobium prioritasuperba]